jgi:hypothetical protein
LRLGHLIIPASFFARHAEALAKAGASSFLP